MGPRKTPSQGCLLVRVEITVSAGLFLHTRVSAFAPVSVPLILPSSRACLLFVWICAMNPSQKLFTWVSVIANVSGGWHPLVSLCRVQMLFRTY